MTVEEFQPSDDGVDITPEKNGGVLKRILKEGSGTELPGQNNEVTVHYTGTLLDGTKFDSSKDRNEPFKFMLGKGSVIKAWDLGVATMKRGEVAVLTCRADYAYGENGSGSIPPNATLLFEVECIDWKGEDLSPSKNEGILREIISKGAGYRSPTDGCQVNVHICGKYEDRIFEDRAVSFTLGEGSEENVIEGVEIALNKFHKGEISRLKIKAPYAFKAAGNAEFNIPPNATVEYEVELKDFETVEKAWSLNLQGQIDQAKIYKDKGGKYFKGNKLALAIKMYTKMLEYLNGKPMKTTIPDEELEEKLQEEEKLKEEEKTLALAAHLNLALCYLKEAAYRLAVDHCDKALALDKDNEKGLFRRGQALMNLSEPEQAKADFETVLRLAPENKAAANSVVLCNNQIKDQKKREKMIYSNMFEKFAQKDREEQLWRYGWWDGKHVKTPEPLKDTELEEAKKEQEKEKIKSKKQFLEAVKKRREELASIKTDTTSDPTDGSEEALRREPQSDHISEEPQSEENNTTKPQQLINASSQKPQSEENNTTKPQELINASSQKPQSEENKPVEPQELRNSPSQDPQLEDHIPQASGDTPHPQNVKK